MSATSATTGFAFDSPHEAIKALTELIQAVDGVSLPLRESFGRVLAEPVCADRDSPPHDVSAMDGYAVGHDTLQEGDVLDIAAEIVIGQSPPDMPARGCLQISTGACVPEGCLGVIPREQVHESPGRITLQQGLQFKVGQHIRRRGENTRQGQAIIPAGTEITPPVSSALAAFGYETIKVYRKVRVAILTTGDELLQVDAAPMPWQIRDSNTSTLLAGLANKPWIQVVHIGHAQDERDRVGAALRDATAQADLILTTGGVSMGDHDYIKPALLDIGGKVVYHKLPVRPGKPGLGGLVPNTTLEKFTPLIAMPGNPVAVGVALPLFVHSVARALGGFQQPTTNRLTIKLTNPPTRKLGLWHYLPAKLTSKGHAKWLQTKGSGDLAGAAPADGYVQMPPDSEGPGPWVFYDARI